ncbi:hypothetical protein [Fibrella aquatica]|uniref:hypothetical protein n=1 Tax=Fibrella aquatica TaxID=3242487 RepID=UPI00352171C6
MTWTTTQQETLLTLIRSRGEQVVLTQQLNHVNGQLQQQQAHQADLYAQWNAEQVDVDRLGRLSWATIYYDLLNRREEQLTKEQAEARSARIAYDAVTAQVDTLISRVASLKNQLVAYADVETRYEALLREKTESVKAKPGNMYEVYATALQTAEQQIREIHEAQQASQEAAHEVNQLAALLDSAISLGNWDMFAGSTLISMAKYSKLDDVRDQSYRVNQSLQRFNLELADLHMQLRADLQLDGFTRFADIFFDNIFTDYSVQQRINKAHHQSRMLADRIIYAQRQLDQQLNNALLERDKRTAELRTYLEQA